MKPQRVKVAEEAYIVVSDLQRLRLVLALLRDVTGVASEPDLKQAYISLQTAMEHLEQRLGLDVS